MPVPSPTLFPSESLFPSDVESGQFTQGVLASFAPWLARDPNRVLNNLLVAFAIMFEPVAQIVMDSGSPDDPAGYVAGFADLLDPDSAPAWALPYTAMFVGVQVPPGTSEAEARPLIRNEAGFKRGTPGALVSAAQRFLGGAQTVFLLERTPTPYSATMVMRPAQVINRTSLESAVLAVKPAGIVITFIYVDQFIWAQAIHTFSADTMTWNATASQQP